MAILKNLYPILLLPILAGCEEDFTPNMPHTPVLCVNSLITAEEPIEISVSKSRLYTDSSYKSEVQDATINIYANGQLQPESYIPNEGDVIKVVAQSKSIGSASAEVTVPKSVPIQNLTWEAYDTSLWISESTGYYEVRFKLKVQLTIADPKGENYYKLSFRSITENDSIDDGYTSGGYGTPNFAISGLQYDAEPIFSEHIGVFESIMGSDAYGFTVFTDRQFSEKSYTLNLIFNECRFTGTIDMLSDCQYEFILKSISSSYYNWSNYNWQRDNGTLTDLSDYGFGDPIWGYSNCTSGAGVVAAQSTNTHDIDFSDFIKGIITNRISQ